MRDVARPEHVVARARLDRRVADLEGEIAFEDPKALVVAVMHVERALVAGVLRHLHDRHLPAGVGRRLNDHEAAEPPARLSLVATDRGRLQRLLKSRLLRHHSSSYCGVFERLLLPRFPRL
ncbi:MAG: hypothetical protein M3214_10375 [Actinomycetota bacterium]|nr:hypothetical protein [Actinomycetota bacterium]